MSQVKTDLFNSMENVAFLINLYLGSSLSVGSSCAWTDKLHLKLSKGCWMQFFKTAEHSPKKKWSEMWTLTLGKQNFNSRHWVTNWATVGEFLQARPVLHFGFSVTSTQAQFQSFEMKTQLMASPRKEAWKHVGAWNGLEGLQQQEGEDGMSELSLRGEQPECAEANPAPVDPSPEGFPAHWPHMWGNIWLNPSRICSKWKQRGSQSLEVFKSGLDGA